MKNAKLPRRSFIGGAVALGNSRRDFMKAMILGLSVGISACIAGDVFARSSNDRLNVIVVMTDDQGYPDISCHGNDVIKTPNMDKLSAGSVRLSDFHVNPFCSPTRAALLTGRMSDRTGVTSTSTHRNYMRREEIVMPEYFKASGYSTAIFGKWHVGANYPYRPMDRGFDQWIGLGNNGLGTTSDLWDNDRMNDTYWHNGKMAKRGGFCTDVYFDEAMAFIKDCKTKDKPFFTYVATNVPHWDWNVPTEWLKPYLDTCSRKRAAFFASIGRVDWNLGRLMEFLEKENLTQNTILVFLTDNGSDVPDKKTAYAAGMRGFKNSRYEGGHRVPCFIHAPENIVGKPRDIDALTAHVDLLPTFIDLCQLKKTGRKQLPMDGRSLRPLLSGNGQWPDRLLVMHCQNSGMTPQKYFRTVVMTKDWRMIIPEKGKQELYKIREDRSQKHDVAGDYRQVVKKLLSDYDTHWDSLDIHRPLERPIISKNATLRLSSDITAGSSPGTQNLVRRAKKPIKEPRWLLEAKAPGRYRFEVRRWPREANAAMTAALAPTKDPDIEYIGNSTYKIDVPGVALDIEQVELKLSGMKTLTRKVAPGAKSVQFDVDLPAGPVDIEAWFIKSNKKRLGAYYVYVEQI